MDPNKRVSIWNHFDWFCPNISKKINWFSRPLASWRTQNFGLWTVQLEKQCKQANRLKFNSNQFLFPQNAYKQETSGGIYFLRPKVELVQEVKSQSNKVTFSWFSSSHYFTCFLFYRINCQTRKIIKTIKIVYFNKQKPFSNVNEEELKINLIRSKVVSHWIKFDSSLTDHRLRATVWPFEQHRPRPLSRLNFE